MILEAEIYDYKLNNYNEAIRLYNEFIVLFPKCIYYERIRLRLRDLIELEIDSCERNILLYIL